MKQPGNRQPSNSRPDGPRDQQKSKLTGRAAIGVLGGLFLLILLRPLIPASWRPKGDHSWTDVILAVLTLGYLIATIFYVRISNRQWRVLQDTLSETQRSNNLSLRAWVELETISLGPITGPGFDVTTGRVKIGPGSAHVTGRVKNVGTLPAFNIQMVQQGVTLPPRAQPESTDFGLSQDLVPVPGSYPMCGGGESRPFEFDITLPEVSMDDIRAGGSIWLQVNIGYTDPIHTQGTTGNVMEYLLSVQHFAFRRSWAE